tara:strand:- start:822 stop:1121 length:300 start_codon:yes stop_codon:yes gene_type:complete
MNIGSFVWNVFHSILRFGTIIDREIDENGWAHFKVEWHEDHAYDQAIAWDSQFREHAEGRLWRADELYPVETIHLAEVIKVRDNFSQTRDESRHLLGGA